MDRTPFRFPTKECQQFNKDFIKDFILNLK